MLKLKSLWLIFHVRETPKALPNQFQKLPVEHCTELLQRKHILLPTLPELGGETVNMNNYDTVFIGYPIWWDLCPRPVNTFIEKYNLSGKTVIPFATSGGSSINNSVKQLKKLYPEVDWKEGRLFNRGSKQAEEWAKQIITK